MSLWRHEASERLPELQGKITSTMVENPADLWMELHFVFDRLCHEEPPPVELLSRIWNYAKLSADHKSKDVQFAVIAFFFDQIKDTRLYRKVLPTFMSVKEYEQICGLHAPQIRKERR